MYVKRIYTITEILAKVAHSSKSFVSLCFSLFYKFLAMEFIASEMILKVLKMILTMCKLLYKVPELDYFLFPIHDWFGLG